MCFVVLGLFVIVVMMMGEDWLEDVGWIEVFELVGLGFVDFFGGMLVILFIFVMIVIDVDGYLLFDVFVLVVVDVVVCMIW